MVWYGIAERHGMEAYEEHIACCMSISVEVSILLHGGSFPNLCVLIVLYICVMGQSCPP